MYVKSNYKEGNKSISASLKAEVDELVEPKLKGLLQQIAVEAVNASPVKTGAFVTSWSIVPSGSGAGRSRTSHGKPRADEIQKKSEALSQLEADIQALDLSENKNTVLRNRAPHAGAVEQKRQIMTVLKDRYR